MIACMGGWCNSREKCAHYYSENEIKAERLCGKNEEPEMVKGGELRDAVGGISGREVLRGWLYPV